MPQPSATAATTAAGAAGTAAHASAATGANWTIIIAVGPIGDPHRPGFHFCAADAPRVDVYCNFHMRVAFARPRQGG